jgi:DNA-binding Xre family transcriptional regulator
MKTVIHGPSRSKVSFIDDLRAKVELENGETWIVGFPTPFNYLSGEHFIQLLGWAFDLYWGFKGTIEDDFRQINGMLYQDGYEMMFFIVLEPKRSEERKRIGERIRELRKKRNLDAKSLAARIGIDASNLSRIEQGHYSVGLDILSKIATALNSKVDIVELD